MARTVFHATQSDTILNTRRERQLREAFAAYGLDAQKLRDLIAQGGDVRQALSETDAPDEVNGLITMLQVLVTPTTRQQIKTPADAAAFCMLTFGCQPQEQLWVLCLNTKNRIQHAEMVYQGTIDTTSVRPAEIFRPAIRCNSRAIIVAHGHPSGDPEPSPEDILMTANLRSAGDLLDVQLLDHLVIGDGKWVSLRERGLGFSAV